MVARTRPDRGGLIAVVSRDGEEPQKVPAADSYRAVAIASRRLPPAFGSVPTMSCMTCRLVDHGPARNPGVLGDLPEV
jgi:hypothetical protein